MKAPLDRGPAIEVVRVSEKHGYVARSLFQPPRAQNAEVPMGGRRVAARRPWRFSSVEEVFRRPRISTSAGERYVPLRPNGHFIRAKLAQQVANFYKHLWPRACVQESGIDRRNGKSKSVVTFL